MKKTVIIVFLLLVIAVSFSFVILRIQANGPEDNFFNKKYREKFAQSQIWRDILGLHFDGDGKSDYLGNQYSKINIEVDEMAGLDISNEALDLLAARMQEVTGKKVSYTKNDSAIPYAEHISEAQIRNLAHLYRGQRNRGDTASVYLLYVNMEDNQLDRLGVTFEEYGIILFAKPLEIFIKSNRDSISTYIESTALHEFGHQLGLLHNNFADCLMQTEADSPSGGTSIVTDFCRYERNLIDLKRLEID